LAADFTLLECIASLEAQTYADFDIIVVDNSGRGQARASGLPAKVTIIENRSNVGFGSAINQGWRRSDAEFVATLNDDAVAHSEWLSELVGAARRHDRVGLCASQVRLFGTETLDSAGMLIAADGSSKQRGHGTRAAAFVKEEEVLLPSGSAALYLRRMLEEIGGFDDDFFLYCEDTDLGLRARWAGWRCVYAPRAVVEHRYSHSAGRASALKAYYVERNRLAVVAKTFPAAAMMRAPFASVMRYLWHIVFMLKGRGAASDFRRAGSGAALPWFVARAHLWFLRNMLRLAAKRRNVSRGISNQDFAALLQRHSISVKQVAAL
jgi:GT2 family glycosyltransferase